MPEKTFHFEADLKIKAKDGREAMEKLGEHFYCMWVSAETLYGDLEPRFDEMFEDSYSVKEIDA